MDQKYKMRHDKASPHSISPFVNSLSSSPLRQNVGSTLNCASCSAAGAVCLLKGSHRFITSSVASEFNAAQNLSVPSYRMGDSVTEQIKNIAMFVIQRSSRDVVESPPNIPVISATKWMLSQPVGTIFVVYTAGWVLGEESFHFLNAANTGKIVYIDFQTNRGPRTTNRGLSYEPYLGHAGPATSDSPFIGVITQKLTNTQGNLHAKVQAGSFDMSTAKLTVLAFR